MERIFILDRSGSMGSCRDDTIGGYNSFVDDQKVHGGTMTLVQFDDTYEIVYQNVPIGEVRPLTRETFVPHGATALHDAIGRTIKDIETRTPPTVIILTDGYENASRKYTKAHVKDLIEQKTKDGWTFVYLGANQDAFTEASGIGISGQCTVNFNTEQTQGVFAALSQAVSNQSQTGQFSMSA